MWLEARHTVPSVVEGVDICRGERVLMEVSRKFTVQDIRELAFKSGFFIQVRWRRLPVSCWQAAGLRPASAREAPQGPAAGYAAACTDVCAYFALLAEHSVAAAILVPPPIKAGSHSIWAAPACACDITVPTASQCSPLGPVPAEAACLAPPMLSQ